MLWKTSIMFNLNNKASRNVLVSCDHGLMIVNRFDYNDENVGQSRFLLDHGNASTVEAEITYQELLNVESPIIFDVGANIGTYTTWLAKTFHTGKVYAFEPQRLVFQMLCGNMAINNIENVHVHNVALGKEEREIHVNEPNYMYPADFGRFSIVRINDMQINNDKSLLIDCTTIDKFMQKHDIPKLDFIKIDAEGMDLDVVDGAHETILKYNPAILIEHTDGIHYSNYDEIVSRMSEYSFYDMIQHGNNLLFKKNQQ